MSWLAGIVIFLAATTASAAAGTTPNLDEAQRLLNTGKPQQALTVLERDFQNFVGIEAYDYLLGLAYYQSGQSGQAYFAFERVLMINPGNVDARLKAAKISATRGDVGAARELLKPLSGMQLSSVQQQEAAKIRTIIETSTVSSTTSLRGYILGGAGWDDNVSSGPDKSSLIIPGLRSGPPPPAPPTPTLMGTAQQEGDQTAMLEAGLSVLKPLNQDTWLNVDGNVHQGYNRTRKDVTESYANLNFGVLRRVGRDYVGIAVLGQDYMVNNINYRNSIGGKLNWIHSLDNQASLTSYIQQLNFILPDHEIDNAKRNVAGITYEAASADSARTFLFGIYGGNQIAQDVTKPHFSFNLWGVNLGGSVTLSKNLSLSTGLAYESRQHTEQDALYLIIRKDAQASAAIAADYRMSERWHMIPLYTYTRNTSNTELYAYSRNTFMLQFRWEFDNEKK